MSRLLTEYIDNSQQNETNSQQVTPEKKNQISQQSSPEKARSDYQTPRHQETDFDMSSKLKSGEISKKNGTSSNRPPERSPGFPRISA